MKHGLDAAIHSNINEVPAIQAWHLSPGGPGLAFD
jgi:hypothetical protein